MVSKLGSKYNPSSKFNVNNLNEPVAVVMIVLNKAHNLMLLNKEFRLGVNRPVYGNVAGLIDEGETPEQAAERELMEETGLKLTKIIDIIPPSYTCAPVSDDMSYVIICETDSVYHDDLISKNPAEVIESIWVPRSAMLSLIRNSDISFAARAQAFAYMWAMGNDL